MSATVMRVVGPEVVIGDDEVRVEGRAHRLRDERERQEHQRKQRERRTRGGECRTRIEGLPDTVLTSIADGAAETGSAWPTVAARSIQRLV